MKIGKMFRAEITDIPVFDSIAITPEQITITGGGFDNQEEAMTHDLSLWELEELRDALTEAIRIKWEMNGESAEPKPLRVFEKNNPEPGPEIIQVVDVDGSNWYRVSGGWSTYRNGSPNPWFEVLNYVPLVEVRDA